MMEIVKLIKEYLSLNLHEVIDHDRFNQYAIVHHSSSIEGSTLTEIETRLLLDEGTTPKGKPLDHSLMVRDHYDALKFTLNAAQKRLPLSTKLIQEINGRVMNSTGKIHNTILGTIYESRGDFRKGNVHAGGSYFVSYDKVQSYTEKLVGSINEKISKNLSMDEQLVLSFSAHFDLVSIHPFYDGNGRTSRLLMNYIQEYYALPLAIVFKEDKADYFEALQQSRKQENTGIFIDFMLSQYTKHLENEITEYKKMTQGQNLKIKNPRGTTRGFSIFF